MPPLIILDIVNTALKIVLLAMESQPVDVRSRMWLEYQADVDKWRSMLGLFIPKS